MRSLPTILLFLSLGLAGCTSTRPLDYIPSVAAMPGPPGVIGDVTGMDMRDEKPNRFATVRGIYGDPAHVRDTPRPVAEEAAGVFAAALQARNMLGQPGNAPYRMQLVLHKLYGNTYLEANAYINIDLILFDRSGREVYRDTIDDRRRHFSPFDQSIGSLQRLVQELLSATADRMLDNPRFRAALAGGVPAAALDRPLLR